MNNRNSLSPKAKAVLNEIYGTLQCFIETGEGGSIFINKMSLSPEERQEIRDYLGQGHIKVSLSETAEPAEWLESGISGIWFGVFYDHTKNPVLETIEICQFPVIASTQLEDAHRGLTILKYRLEGEE